MIHNNKFLILLFLGFNLSLTGQGQWKSEKCPTTNNLNSIHLIDDNFGWIVGDNGTMLYKNITGWMNAARVTDNDLFSVFLINKSEGWAVGSRGTILRLDGNRWNPVASPTMETLYSITFSDPDHGTAVGEHGTVISIEKGICKLASKRINGNLYTVSSKNDLSMIGGGLEAMSMPMMTLVSRNEKEYVPAFKPDYIEIRGIKILNANNIWAIGRPGIIFHFDGSTWSRYGLTEKLPSLMSLFFTDENHGISVGYGGTIMVYHTDGWTKEDSPVNVKLNGSFISNSKYYTVGNSGTILSCRYSSENESGHLVSNNSDIHLNSYPNPASDELNIIIPDEDGFIGDQMIVTNIFGQVIFNKKINGGNTDLLFCLNTSRLLNGLYFMNIISTTRKKASGSFIVKH